MIAQQIDREVSTEKQALTGIGSITDDVTQPDVLLHSERGAVVENRPQRGQIGMDITDDCRLQLRPPDPSDPFGFTIGPSIEIICDLKSEEPHPRIDPSGPIRDVNRIRC